jgi:hypothetical protein
MRLGERVDRDGMEEVEAMQLRGEAEEDRGQTVESVRMPGEGGEEIVGESEQTGLYDTHGQHRALVAAQQQLGDRTGEKGAALRFDAGPADQEGLGIVRGGVPQGPVHRLLKGEDFLMQVD